MLRDQPWQRWRVKDGEKGPMIWEIKQCRFTRKGKDGMPGKPMHLIVARDVLDPEEIKFFVSNAPPETSIQSMLLVANTSVTTRVEQVKAQGRAGDLKGAQQGSVAGSNASVGLEESRFARLKIGTSWVRVVEGC